MAVYELTLSSLDELDDGRVTVAWQQALKRAVADCEDRPGVNDARKVVLETQISPLIGEDGHLDTVRVQFQIKDSAPTRKTKKYSMQPRSGNVLVYNDLSDDDIHQHTIDEV